MRKVKNINHLIGKEFGLLKILEDRGVKNKCRIVNAQCECGVIKEYHLAAIKRGTTKSCGHNKKLNIDDFINKRFGKLIIVENVGREGNNWKVKIKCDCGNYKVTNLYSIKYGKTKSCGCLCVEKLGKSKRTHGLSHHPLYGIWNGMKDSCLNKKGKDYENYGGRGVKVSTRWENDFQAFYDWAIKRWQPGLQLDKDIKSSTGYGILYCPELCCFVEPKDNSNSKGNNRKIQYNGENKTVSQWAEILNINLTTLIRRLNHWSVESAFTMPVKKYNYK